MINVDFTQLIKETIELLKRNNVRDDVYSDFIMLMFAWTFGTPDEREIKINGVNYTDRQFHDLIQHVAQTLDKSMDNDSGFRFVLTETERIPDSEIKRLYQLWFHFLNSHLDEELFSIENLSLFFDIISEQLIPLSPEADLRFTPSGLTNLLANLVESSQETPSVYDPYSRSGEILNKVLKFWPNAKGNGKISNIHSGVIAKTRAYVFRNRLQLKFQNKSTSDFDKSKFDIIVSNPPFQSNEQDFLFIEQIVNRLNENGSAGVIIPDRVLFGNSLLKLRESLIAENLIEAIIHLPQKIYFRSNAQSSILLLKKGRKAQKILMVDLSKLKSHTALEKLTDLGISDLIKAFRESSDSEANLSKQILGLDTVRENNFNLQYSTYTEPEVITRVSSDQLFAECEELESKLITIKEKLNQIRKS